MTMGTTLPDATRGERIRSAGATVLATAVVFVVATLLVGLVLFVWALLSHDPVLNEISAANTRGGLGAPFRTYWSSSTSAGPAWLGPAVLGAVLIVTWLGSARMGLGTPGDAVMSLSARTVDGAPLPRWRNLLRTGVPLALFALGVALGSVWIGVALVAAGWAPALVRADRRTAYDLLAGVRVGTNAPVKGDFEWKVGTGAKPTD
jgi:hypothetical protein